MGGGQIDDHGDDHVYKDRQKQDRSDIQPGGSLVFGYGGRFILISHKRTIRVTVQNPYGF
jgi:hypothetical protein